MLSGTQRSASDGSKRAAARARWITRVKAISHVTGLSSLLALRQSGIRILMYHGVGGLEFPVAEFERQIQYLTDRYEIVTIDEALESLARGRRHTPPRLVLTFDDGLWCHYQDVYPVLARWVAPAVFYACPDLIEQGRWMWNHEATARLDWLDASVRRRFASAAGVEATDSADIVEWMKELPAGRRHDLSDQLRELTPSFEPSEEQRQRFDPMSWPELISLDPRIITVGSHTLTHPILTGLDIADVKKEVVESRERLEAKLRRPVEHFCFPNGRTNPAVSATLKGVYRSAVTTECRIARHGDDLLALPRLPAAEELERLSWRLQRPSA